MKNAKVLLIGATGFTGRLVLLELLKRGFDVESLVRAGSENKFAAIAPKGAKHVIGDLDDKASLVNALKGKDALVFVASMGFGQMTDVAAACEDAGVKRGIFTSSTAIFTRLAAQSKDGREAGEKAIMASDMDWTILRPTMIFGRKGDRNIERLVKMLRKLPIVPLVGCGSALQQPIFVDDVAKAVVDAFSNNKTIKKAYNISGAQALTFKQLANEAGQALGRRILFVPIPLTILRLAARFYEKISKNPRLKEEQILRLNENKAFSHEEAARDFNFKPRPFSYGVKNLVKELTE